MTKFALCGLDTALDIELFVKYDSEDIVPGTDFVYGYIQRKLNRALGVENRFIIREVGLDKRD